MLPLQNRNSYQLQHRVLVVTFAMDHQSINLFRSFSSSMSDFSQGRGNNDLPFLLISGHVQDVSFQSGCKHQIHFYQNYLLIQGNETKVYTQTFAQLGYTFLKKNLKNVSVFIKCTTVCSALFSAICVIHRLCVGLVQHRLLFRPPLFPLSYPFSESNKICKFTVSLL